MYDAPSEFTEHIEHITRLVDLIEDDAVRVQLLDAVEVLVQGMNGPWQGSTVGWRWGEVPDDAASLFDEGS